METVEITDILLEQGQLFKDMQADFRENKRRDAEVYRMNKQGELNSKKNEKAIEMKNLTDELSVELAAYTQTSNILVKGVLAEDDAKV